MGRWIDGLLSPKPDGVGALRRFDDSKLEDGLIYLHERENKRTVFFREAGLNLLNITTAI